jgi:hypothetical protein
MNARAWFYSQSFHSNAQLDDPIMDRSELTHNQDENLRECEACGEPVEVLHTVNDDDPSVGYHGELHVCDECRERGRRP